MTKPILTLLLTFTLFFAPTLSHAQFVEWTNSACHSETEPAVYDIGDGDVPTIRGIECLVVNILATAIPFIGLAVFIMLIIGGYQILMSGGDPQKVAGGKTTITLALTGLLIALSSWLIIYLIATFTGANQEDTGDIRKFDTQTGNP